MQNMKRIQTIANNISKRQALELFSTQKNVAESILKSSPKIDLQKPTSQQKQDLQNLELFRHQNYSFRMLTNQRKQQGLKLILGQFRDQQPLINSYKKLFPQQRKSVDDMTDQIWTLLMENFANNKLSVCVIDLQTNELAGISGAKDYTYVPDGFEERYLKSRNYVSSVINMFEEMAQKLDLQVQQLLNKPGQVMDIYAVGLKKQHMGKKLAHKMMLGNQMLALKQGYQHSLVFATNFKTGIALSKLNYQKIIDTKCNEFEFGGFKPFSMIEQLQRRPSIWMKKFI